MARHASVTKVRDESIASPSRDDFAAMLEESFITQSPAEGSVIKGKIVSIENDFAIVDVGLKTEGRVSLKEFSMPGVPVTVKVGDEVEVYLERVENALGEAVLSRDKARREESWIRLERAFNEQTRVTGVIFGRVKGGFTVDLDGAVAFLPGSQVDVRPMRDVGPLMNQPQPFQILKMDRRRGNIVVSRRAVLEERRAEERSSLVASLQEKQVVEGIVKNITDYGAFVDLGGVDGLLHVTDIAWRRVSHPTEVLLVGQTVTVQIIKINHETQRISLGMKQLQTDPWEGVAAKYPSGARFTGKVTNVTDYGAFVELEPGVEGLVHVSEMSWVKKNVAPSKIVIPGTEVEVQVLEVDSNKRRISLGLKQTQDNPWQVFAASHPAGTVVEGEIKSITEFGLFVGVAEDIDGMVHLSDISWDKAGDQAVADYTKGQIVKAKVLDVDVEKERISLGIKQMGADPIEKAGPLKKGSVVTVTVTEVNDGGIEVELDGGARSFIRRSDLARDRADQRPERFGKGDKVDALVTSVDKSSRKIALSIKAREISEEKEAVAQYGSSDSGASLGDILGAALRRRTKKGGDDNDDEKEDEKEEENEE
ncbi:MAG: 30S ribosomal protein S1 [Alphaproteobacteria bacterium]|nr:30S ribosomal protein S1 [Alphaproteobacteria bacterium]MDE2500643.1 30S ribosomal protein S1 [Alphaproteobacteria bacterium]